MKHQHRSGLLTLLSAGSIAAAPSQEVGPRIGNGQGHPAATEGPASPGRRQGPAPAEPDTATGALRQARGTTQIRRIGWWLTLAFCGQAIAYYSVTAWLPTLLADTRGLSLAASGAGASLFQVAAIAGALGVPLLAARAPSWVPVTVIGALWITLPVGLLIAPEGYLVWSAVGGVAQGGGFTTIFSIVARIVRTDAEAAATSARIQGSGYLAAINLGLDL